MMIMKLNEICEVYSGYALKSFNDAEDGLPVVKIGNILTDGTLNLDECQYTTDSVNEKYYSNKGDIYIALSGATTGKIGIMDADERYVVNQRVGIVRKKFDDVPQEYIKYFLLRQTDRILQEAAGCAQPNISPKQIAEYSVPEISKEKMFEVCSVLDKTKRMIDMRKAELTALDDLIKARFVELFGSVHEDRFPKCALRDVAHIKHGYAFSGEFFSEEDNGVVLVTPGNFALGGGFQEVRNKYFTSEYPEEYVLHAGDLIVTMTDLSKKADTLGYGAIVPNTDKIYLHNQRIGLFDKLDDRLNPVFVRWYMQTDEYRLEIVRTSTGSTVHHTSPDRILNSVIFIPPIELQNEFVDFVKQVDKSKVAVQKSLDETQQLFDSLMQQYFG